MLLIDIVLMVFLVPNVHKSKQKNKETVMIMITVL